LNFCAWKDRKCVAVDLRRIYGAATADAAAVELARIIHQRSVLDWRLWFKQLE
jgi:transposase-like protein